MIVAGILLAAGAGRRFGAAKALVRWDGQLLVERGVATLAAGGCAPVCTVLGAAATAVRHEARLGSAVVVEVADHHAGMGASLVAGLAAAADAGADAVVVGLVDQPLIDGRAVAAVRAALEAGTPLAVATYGGRRGHPVGLAASTWAEVRTSAVGERGARTLLAARDDVVEVPCDGLGRPDDVDTVDQLHELARDVGAAVSIPASRGMPDADLPNRHSRGA